MGIQKLSISGFKSIDNVELTDLPNYCVFAGANGAGKTNFFDSLKFASQIIELGITHTLREFGGYEWIRNKHSKTKNDTFCFGCGTLLDETKLDYSMQIQHLESQPVLMEKAIINQEDKEYVINWNRLGYNCKVPGHGIAVVMDKKIVPKNISLINPSYDVNVNSEEGKLLFQFGKSLTKDWYNSFRIFRFDPFRAKEPDELGADSSFLDSYGRNLATVLEGIQKNQDDFETVMEWMSMIVPGLVEIETYRNPLDGRASMAFRESGTDYRFPPLLISDGTVYVLCLLAAVLTRIKQPGITMIEEPERGIHPSANEQLSEFFRVHASDEHQIFISTHNESFVRNAKSEELFFAVKKEGRTEFRLGRDATKAVEGMPNDKAWLQNLFDGGLPW